MAVSVGSGLITVVVCVLAAVIGHPINLDSKPQMVAVAGDKTQSFVSELLARMMAHRKWQDSALREYQAHRLFHASNNRFNIDSTLEVQTTFRAPGLLQSTVLSQEGSSFIREHVFEKILSAESELLTKDTADVIPENYLFTLIGSDACEGRRCWHMALKPRRPDKYLVNGDVWLDAEDYAVCHVHGIPSKHVSLWISHAEVDWRYRRVNAGIWLTDKIESSSDVRLVGQVLMQIRNDYNNVGVASVAKMF